MAAFKRGVCPKCGTTVVPHSNGECSHCGEISQPKKFIDLASVDSSKNRFRRHWLFYANMLLLSIIAGGVWFAVWFVFTPRPGFTFEWIVDSVLLALTLNAGSVISGFFTAGLMGLLAARKNLNGIPWVLGCGIPAIFIPILPLLIGVIVIAFASSEIDDIS